MVPTQLLRVVLDAGDTEFTREGLEQHSFPKGIQGSPWAVGRESLAVLYLKVRWFWLQRRPVSAYRFRRMLDFIRAPN